MVDVLSSTRSQTRLPPAGTAASAGQPWVRVVVSSDQLGSSSDSPASSRNAQSRRAPVLGGVARQPKVFARSESTIAVGSKLMS